jgi:hypothetical protein
MIQVMRNWTTIFIWTIFGFLFFSLRTHAQLNADSAAMFFYIKKELNAGAVFNFNTEREEVRTDKSINFEELKKGSASFLWGSRNWLILPYLQETWNIALKAGPYWGKGDWIDSSEVQLIDTEQKLTGIGGSVQANYSGRFYFDQKNYTLINVKAWGDYSLFQRKAEGTLVDSNQVAFPYDKSSEHSKLRYGIEAKAGWGIGRLNPVNYYMAADWLLEKYYPGRLFSVEEKLRVAREIGRIKNQRDARAGHSAEKEWEQLAEFLNTQMFLEVPDDALPDWQYTEFRPRFSGFRVEFGPFFNYFNREPDFVYGGYLKFEHHKYCSLKRNRNLSARLSYNGYKRKDWILLETDLGWTFYPGLKSEYGFGLKYIPGMVVDGFDDLEPVRHNFVPYMEYFSQISSKYRIETTLAWRITPNDQFMLPGPEVTLSVYRSKY